MSTIQTTLVASLIGLGFVAYFYCYLKLQEQLGKGQQDSHVSWDGDTRSPQSAALHFRNQLSVLLEEYRNGADTLEATRKYTTKIIKLFRGK